YPNPFNTRTIINYDLNKTDHTRLILYDVHGREMAVLVNEVQNTGSHSVMLDADDYPSGVYFYCLESGDQIMTRKMTLLK
ncbi:T9SS type A sorting domain-containing protein, partial [candidate division KSB1 bacterium]|nr:T9SS type A sorting domain-containing protein [candidate division KSB1 bacterium]